MAARLAGPAERGKFSLGQLSEMNVTPFVDVMLVLLIIFMVAAPLATTAIKLDIPVGSHALSTPPPIVSVAADGRLYLTTGATVAPTSLDTLGTDLSRTGQTSQVVMIRAEPHVRYGAFMAVIDRLQTDGYFNVGLVSEAI